MKRCAIKKWCPQQHAYDEPHAQIGGPSTPASYFLRNLCLFFTVTQLILSLHFAIFALAGRMVADSSVCRFFALHRSALAVRLLVGEESAVIRPAPRELAA